MIFQKVLQRSHKYTSKYVDTDGLLYRKIHDQTPYAKISMDLMGKYIPTKNGHPHILRVIDQLTSYVVAGSILDKT